MNGDLWVIGVLRSPGMKIRSQLNLMKKENFVALSQKLTEYKYFICEIMTGIINHD